MLPSSAIVEVWYAEKNMSSKVVYYDDCGDSAAWTGLYLASLAHQYNVTQSQPTLVSWLMRGLARSHCTVDVIS